MALGRFDGTDYRPTTPWCALKSGSAMKIRSRFAIRQLGRLLAGTARLYFRLVRTEIHLTQPLTSPYERKGETVYLYCLWHHSIPPTDTAGTSGNVTSIVAPRAKACQRDSSACRVART